MFRARLLLPALLGFVTAVACRTGFETCEPGTEECSCTANGGCLPDLECVADLCLAVGGETGESEASSAEMSGSESADSSSESQGEGGDGDGDGDATTGDGDGDSTTGDGDGDGDATTGDGDGDGDSTTGDGDGDGDSTTGDGDGDGDSTTGDGDGDGDSTSGDGDGDGDGANEAPVFVSLVATDDTITEASFIELTATATDDVGVTRVDFFVTGEPQPFASDNTTPFNAQWLAQTADEGNVEFSAVAYDAEGLSDSGIETVNIDIAQAAGSLYAESRIAGDSVSEWNDVAVGPDGSIYTAGRISDDSLTNGLFQKFDSTLNPMWGPNNAGISYNGQGNNNDAGKVVAVDPNGVVVVAGVERISGVDHLFARRFTSGGSEVWTEHYAKDPAKTDDAIDMVFLPDGTPVLLAQHLHASSSFERAMWLIGLNPATGALVWEVSFDNAGQADVQPQALALAADGNLIVGGGFFDTPSNELKSWVAKYDSSENQLWSRTQGGVGGLDASAYDIAALDNGGAILTGYLETGPEQVWLREYDSAGIPGNDYNYGPTSIPGSGTYVEARHIEIGPRGDINLAGEAFGGTSPVWVQRLDPSAVNRWQGGQPSATVKSMTLDNLGRIVVAGRFSQGYYLAVFSP